MNSTWIKIITIVNIINFISFIFEIKEIYCNKKETIAKGLNKYITFSNMVNIFLLILSCIIIYSSPKEMRWLILIIIGEVIIVLSNLLRGLNIEIREDGVHSHKRFHKWNKIYSYKIINTIKKKNSFRKALEYKTVRFYTDKWATDEINIDIEISDIEDVEKFIHRIGIKLFEGYPKKNIT